MHETDTSSDDASRLRISRQAASDASTRTRSDSSRGAPCQVGKVISGSAASPSFFGMEAYSVTGAEVEGGTGTLTDAGAAFVALNLGSAIPVAGTTMVLCTFTDFRWTFRYDS